MSTEKQKEVAKYILNKLQTVDMWATLAGGACRDWYLGNTASDLDFYIHYSGKYPQWALCEHFGNLLGCEMKIVGKPSGYQNQPDNGDVHYTQNPDVEYVLGGVVNGVPVQIVIMNCLVNPEQMVRSFCFDICQAYTRNIDELHMTKAFNEAVKHKVIRVTGEFWSQKEAYIKKIKSKFPDYLHIGF